MLCQQAQRRIEAVKSSLQVQPIFQKSVTDLVEEHYSSLRSVISFIFESRHRDCIGGIAEGRVLTSAGKFMVESQSEQNGGLPILAQSGYYAHCTVAEDRLWTRLAEYEYHEIVGMANGPTTNHGVSWNILPDFSSEFVNGQTPSTTVGHTSSFRQLVNFTYIEFGTINWERQVRF